MSITDFTFTDITKELQRNQYAPPDRVVRVHRATCKRQPSGARPLAEAGPDVFKKARPASCCKPRGFVVYAPDAPEREAVTKKQEAPASVARHFKPLSQTRPELTTKAVRPDYGKIEQGDHKEVELAFKDELPLAKHYWKVFGRQAALTVATWYGSIARTTKDGVRIYGHTAAVDDTVSTLKLLWREGSKEFQQWRKTDPEYLATKKADGGHHWFKSQRAAAELAFLADLVEQGQKYL